MKRLTYSITATLGGLLIALFVAYRLLVSPLHMEISSENAGLAALEEEQVQLEAEVKTLSTKVKEQLKAGSAGRLMKPGEESLLLGGVLAIASASDVLVQGFELQQAFRVKGEADAANFGGRPEPLQPAQLPQLDENGMPIGAVTDEGDDEWPGVEVLPVSMKLKATFSSFGRFFDLLKKKLPLWGIQTLKLDLDGSGIIRGDVRLTFPTIGSRNTDAMRNTTSGR